MPKLILTFPKLFCKRQQGLTGYYSDEIYLAAQIIAGTWNNGSQIVEPAGEIRKIHVLPPIKINRGQTKNWQEEIEFELGDASAFTIKFGLYEKDNGMTYNKLKSIADSLVKPDQLDLKKLIKETWEIVKKIKMPESLDDAIKVLNTLAEIGKVYKEVNKFLQEDDLLGNEIKEIDCIVNETSLILGQLREFRIENKKISLLSDYIYDVVINIKVK